MSKKQSEIQPLIPLTNPVLFERLTTFAYEKSHEFQQGRTHGIELGKKSLILVEFDENSEDEDPAYNTHAVAFSARRSPLRSKRGRIPAPDSFQVNYEKVTVTNGVPPQLTNFISAENIYSDEEMRIVQGITYDIVRDDIFDIDITRNISYELIDSVGVSHYRTSEDYDEAMSEVIAQTDQSGSMMKQVDVDKHPDTFDQFLYNETFSDLFDGVLHADLYKDLIAKRDAEASLCVQILIRCLKSHDSIPDVISKTPTEIQTVINARTD